MILFDIISSMNEVLRIKANQGNDFNPLDLYTGSDFLRPVQLFSTIIFVKIGDGQNKVDTIMTSIASNQQPLFEYYNFHGLRKEVPIVKAETICSYDHPYPHDEITVVFPLSAEQIRELQPTYEIGEFGY
jgi:hypothetical protein